jgi:hypothetical protein
MEPTNIFDCGETETEHPKGVALFEETDHTVK